jgi:hypothetical protein
MSRGGFTRNLCGATQDWLLPQGEPVNVPVEPRN